MTSSSTLLPLVVIGFDVVWLPVKFLEFRPKWHIFRGEFRSIPLIQFCPFRLYIDVSIARKPKVASVIRYIGELPLFGFYRLKVASVIELYQLPLLVWFLKSCNFVVQGVPLLNIKLCCLERFARLKVFTVSVAIIEV